MKTILKVLVGSQAHGLADENSDFDYRGVFVMPTSEILKIGGTTENTHWIEGKVDDTSWEIGHFLKLAVHCNPTILETFLSPVITETEEGKELRALFPYIWNTNDVRNAFIGYGFNQRKKMLEDKDNRPWKYACAYLRTLFNAHELLGTGTFTIKVSEKKIGAILKDIRQGKLKYGEIIDVCRYWEEKINTLLTTQQTEKHTDIEKINEFLLKVRKNNW